MPASEIVVYVVDYGPRRNLMLRYEDPITGQQHAKTSGTKKRKEAERAAAIWEAELRAGVGTHDGRLPWAEFLDRYVKNHLGSLASNSEAKATGVLDSFGRRMKPGTLADVTPVLMTSYQTKLRDRGLAESTITAHVAHIRAALGWAVDMGYLRAVPKFRRPARKKSAGAKPMKGRPLTDSEFRDMVAAVPAVVGQSRAAEWTRYLRGLWVSGLRLEESLPLSWSDRTVLMVDLSGRRPVLHIPGDQEKGGQDRILPVAPEFAAFLEETPPSLRRGPVFSFPKSKNRKSRDGINHQWVSRVVSAIGKEAGIIVDAKSGKFASAHDLRRSFGSRWAVRVMPQVLMELMRHSDISTTLRYYVGINAERTADVLWDVFGKLSSDDGNNWGNTASTG